MDYVENVSNAVLSVDADIADVLHVEVFNGYLYLCAKHRNGMTQHYYLDGSPDGAAIVDEHCPHSAGFIKKAGKILPYKMTWCAFRPRATRATGRLKKCRLLARGITAIGEQ